MPEAARFHAPCFLILRGGAIGDFIATLPVLQALRAHGPSPVHRRSYAPVAQLALL